MVTKPISPNGIKKVQILTPQSYCPLRIIKKTITNENTPNIFPEIWNLLFSFDNCVIIKALIGGKTSFFCHFP